MIQDAVLGVISFATSAGANADDLRLGGISAKISPAPTNQTIDKISVSAAGSTNVQTIQAVVSALGLEWRPWAGVPGGLAGIPVGDGLAVRAAVKFADIRAQGAIF